jgi:hypothetical protein
MHDVLIVSVPLITILAGLFFNRTEISSLRAESKADNLSLRNELKAEIRELRSEMNARFDRVDAELRYFHGVTGKLDGRIEALEKR